MKTIFILGFITLGMMQSTAQVGIGVDIPTNKLDVNGDLRVRTIEALPSNTTFRNVVADDQGVLKSIQSTNVLVGADGIDAVTNADTVSVSTTGGLVSETIISKTFTLTQRSVVSFTYTIGVDRMDPDGNEDISDSAPKFISTRLFFDPNVGGVSGTITRNSIPYTNKDSGDDVNGLFYQTGSGSRVLDPGTYKVDLEGSVFVPGISFQGVKATFGTSDIDRLDIISQPL